MESSIYYRLRFSGKELRGLIPEVYSLSTVLVSESEQKASCSHDKSKAG